MTEVQLLHAILLTLGARNDCRIWRVNVIVAQDRATGRVVRSSQPGAADISGILKPSGRRLELEVKSENGRVRPEQAAFLKMVREHGGVAEVVRSVEEAVAAVERG